MNIATRNIDHTELTGFDSFIAQKAQIVEALSQKKALLENAKNFLDQAFPLDSGSHNDVKSYLVYYNHLMAFFEDGSHCGLAQPNQFVGLCGHRENPEALLLKVNDCYVEITIDRNGSIGKYDKAHIDDVQLETNRLSEDASRRVWFSMLKDLEQGMFGRDGKKTSSCCEESKEFTNKSGELIKL